MKLFIQKIISFFLAFVVLFSTTSFTIEKHVCGENICSISLEEVSFETNQKLFPYLHEEDESCCLDEETSCCIDGDNCCENEYVVIKGAKIKKEKEVKVKVKSGILLIYVPVPEELTVYAINNKKELSKSYLSPILDKDILALYQIYLI